MVLKPCDVGIGNTPDCKCGNLGKYNESTNKCECSSILSSYDEATRQCKCLPGYEENSVTTPFMKTTYYCERAGTLPVTKKVEYGWAIALGVLGGLTVIGYLAYRYNQYALNNAPLVQAVVAPAAPAAIVPGIVMQNNPMLGANV
jgi:hypothetical protein